MLHDVVNNGKIEAKVTVPPELVDSFKRHAEHRKIDLNRYGRTPQFIIALMRERLIELDKGDFP